MAVLPCLKFATTTLAVTPSVYLTRLQLSPGHTIPRILNLMIRYDHILNMPTF